MKNSIQEASWGALGVSTAQGKGREQDTGQDRGRSWAVVQSQQRLQLTYRRAAGLAWGKGAGPTYPHNRPVQGCRLLWKGRERDSWAEPLPRGLTAEGPLAAGGIDPSWEGSDHSTHPS